MERNPERWRRNQPQHETYKRSESHENPDDPPAQLSFDVEVELLHFPLLPITGLLHQVATSAVRRRGRHLDVQIHAHYLENDLVLIEQDKLHNSLLVPIEADREWLITPETERLATIGEVDAHTDNLKGRPHRYVILSRLSDQQGENRKVGEHLVTDTHPVRDDNPTSSVQIEIRFALDNAIGELDLVSRPNDQTIDDLQRF